MPAAGTTKISKQTKAMILAEKRVGMGTTAEIAARHGVAVQTVRNLSSSPPAAIAPLVEKLTHKLNEEAIEGAVLVFKEIKRRLKENPANESTKDLVAVGKMFHDIHRLETNQPTQINHAIQAPIDRAIRYAKILLEKYGPEDGRQVFRLSQKAKFGVGACDEDWIEAESRVFDE